MRVSELLNEASIKLGGTNKAAESFMKDVFKVTYPNPFDGRMRIWDDSVGIELWNNMGRIHISSIMSFKAKNIGEASKALKWLCDLADKYQVEMDLTVKPIKNAGAREGKDLNKSQLKAWYARNGFVGTHDRMIRTPKAK